MKVEVNDWVVYHPGMASFGQVLFTRDDYCLVEEVTPGTRYANERRRPRLIPLDEVVGTEKTRFPIERACGAMRRALRPGPSDEALTQIGLKAIKEAKVSLASSAPCPSPAAASGSSSGC